MHCEIRLFPVKVFIILQLVFFSQKNATTTTVAAGTEKQFQKITRKKSRGEPIGSNLMSKNVPGDQNSNKQKLRSSVKVVETPQLPVAVTPTRFSVLSSVAAAVGFSVKSTAEPTTEPKDHRTANDGSFILNNDKRLNSSTFFRSKSATREATYINNDLNSQELDGSSVDGSEDGDKSNLGRFRTDNQARRYLTD